MKPEKETLRKRELELQRLMRQMKFDDLHKSQVYKNLERELQTLQQSKEEIPANIEQSGEQLS